MKKVILRYGLYASITIIVFFAVTWLVFNNDQPDYELQEILGYTGMILSLMFVFFGIRYYRDHINSGQLGFGEGIKLGSLIVLIPSLAFGLFDIIYVTLLDPEFMDKYYSYELNKMKNSMNEDEYKSAATDMESLKAAFSNPFVQFIVMFLTVFLIGFIITIISTLLLKRKTNSYEIAGEKMA